MSKIQVMSMDLSNKIAAGEVIEKTMNVVKELVENSIDAGATTIKIDLLDSGVGEIIVTDDGVGMDREDATLAFSRHATSKLKSLNDLYKLKNAAPSKQGSTSSPRTWSPKKHPSVNTKALRPSIIFHSPLIERS